jgi:hypothetical protein
LSLSFFIAGDQWGEGMFREKAMETKVKELLAGTSVVTAHI